MNLVFGRSWVPPATHSGLSLWPCHFEQAIGLVTLLLGSRLCLSKSSGSMVLRRLYSSVGLVGSIWDVAGASRVTLAVAVNWSMMTILTMRSLKIGTLELIYLLPYGVYFVSLLSDRNNLLKRQPVMPFNTSMVVGSYCSFISALLVMFTATSTLRTLRVWVRFYRAARHGS